MGRASCRLARCGHTPCVRRPSPVREALLRYLVLGLAAVVLVGLLGAWLARRVGEAEAIRDAKDQVHLAADGSIEPAVTDALVQGNPQALDAFDRIVNERVLTDRSIARVKLWDPSGRIVYSDEPRLIGAHYHLGPDDLAEFHGSRAHAEVSDLSKPENRFERGLGKLLEVYVPIKTPSGRPLRYETYYYSSFISARGRHIFGEFAPAMIGGLLLLALIQLPLAWQLAKGVERGQRDRERLLQRAIESSDLERRRIARDLHDGVVQDLAAVSFSLAAAAEGAPAPYDAELRTAATETRHGIGQLRTLLVEIYPPELHRAGLEAALGDLLASASARGIETHLEVEPASLPPETEALFFRVAQEAVRNAVKHAKPSQLRVQVRSQDGRARLVVEDDGRGFDPGETAAEDHFGLRILQDLARDSGATLDLASQPGEGTKVVVEGDA
jgi:two-component system NarL family sensor kinase